jgi:hypothetical protein
MASVSDLVTMAASDPSIQAGLQVLTPPQLQAIAGQLQTAAADASPAIALASTVAAGKTPNESQIVGALSATAGMINPIAGAMIGAMGAGLLGFESALQGLFTALGLYGPPAPEYHYHGFLRIGIDPPPYSKADTALWVDVSTLAKFDDITIRNKPFGPYPPLSGYVDPNMVNLFGKAYRQLMPQAAQAAEMGVANDPNEVKSLYVVSTDFERYFYPLFLRNMQYWANAQPSIPPKKLLQAAATLWNSSHSASTTKTFQPTVTNDVRTSLVSDILSPAGDSSGNLQRDPPLTIHTGPVVQPTVPTGGAHKVAVLKLPQRAPIPSSIPAPQAVIVPPPPATGLKAWLPFVPAAVGVLTFPFFGWLPPVVGTIASGVWVELRKKK